MKRRSNALPWRLGRTSKQELLGLLLFFWAGLSPLGLAESIPPPTIKHLVQADFIAVGHFEEKQDGAIVFVTRDVLKGGPSRAKAFVESDSPSVRKSNGGQLEFWSMALYAQTVSSWGGGASIDPTKDLLWFFSEGLARGVDCQPLELTNGYQALLNGEETEQRFRLLQELDPDMRREAMELLVARKDQRVIEDLHRIALNHNSPAALVAVLQLDRAGVLEATRFWGKWNRHPAAWRLSEVLVRADAEAFLGEIMDALDAEEHPPRVSNLLYELGRLYPREVYVDTMIAYLDHPAADVRRRAVGELWDAFWRLGAERRSSSDAQVEFDELSSRVIPLLTERLKTEEDEGVRRRMTRLLAQKDELPVQEEELIWSEAQELKALVQRLTSGGPPWVQATAGRELVQHHLDDGLEEMTKYLDQDDVYNTDLVMKGLGFLRHPKCFRFIAVYSRSVPIGHRNYDATLVALGRQSVEGSVEALVAMDERLRSASGRSSYGLFDALGECRDPRAYSKLKSLKARVKYDDVAYVRALVRHGDRWATGELIQGLRDIRECELLREHSQEYLIDVVTFVDGAEATDLLKKHVAAGWPRTMLKPRTARFYGSIRSMYMKNFAGPARRSTPIGEVARRDPAWLAALALKRMGEKNVAPRILGLEVFRQLTGRSFDFDPEAFAADRAAPLEEARKWWEGTKTNSRDEWLLSYFAAKGFRMKRVYDKESLPILARALEADPFTHSLALEQISAITQKYFTHFKIQHSYRGQQKMTTRVLWWLKARGYLPR